MPHQKYLFQQKQQRLTKKIFKHGLSVSAYILLSLQEFGEAFLEGLPDCYPSFKMMKSIFGVSSYPKRYQNKIPPKQSISVNLSRLKKQGLVVKDSVKKVYCLTEQGKRLTTYVTDRYEILKKPWDKKFRIVIFDIPENKKHLRQWLRQELALMQFERLQKSVYVGKYPLPTSLYKELSELELDSNIFVLTVGEIDKQEEISALLKEK